MRNESLLKLAAKRDENGERKTQSRFIRLDEQGGSFKSIFSNHNIG